MFSVILIKYKYKGLKQSHRDFSREKPEEFDSCSWLTCFEFSRIIDNM